MADIVLFAAAFCFGWAAGVAHLVWVCRYRGGYRANNGHRYTITRVGGMEE